jgi:hypothetical protein
MLRTLEQEHKDRQVIEMRVVALVRDNKASWEKKHKQEIADLERQVEVCLMLL